MESRRLVMLGSGAVNITEEQILRKYTIAAGRVDPLLSMAPRQPANCSDRTTSAIRLNLLSAGRDGWRA